MIVTLCSSASFFVRLLDLEHAMKEHGHQVLLPSMANFHDRTEDALAKIHHNLIREHFNKIARSDAIYVANYEKKRYSRIHRWKYLS